MPPAVRRPSTPARVAACVAAALALASAAPAARAQMTPSCSYDLCALRVEPSFLGGVRLVKGTAGAEVAKLGLFGSNLERHLAGADSAVRYAREYRHNQTVGGVLALASGLAAGVVGARLVRDVEDDADRNRLTSGDQAVLLGAVVGSVVSAYFIQKGQRALARSVWWYNRQLAR